MTGSKEERVFVRGNDMEVGSTSDSCLLMCFGDSNSNSRAADAVGDDGLCPMILTAPTPPSHHCNFNFPIPQPPASTVFMETDHASSAAEPAVKAKIMSHPLYRRLLASYVNCQKVGAPPEVAAKLDEACAAAKGSVSGCVGEDTALDLFMEAYCEMLTQYEQELSKPFDDAMLFLQRVESQFNALTIAPLDSSVFSDAEDPNAISEDGLTRYGSIDPLAEDSELKSQLLRKYSGYLGSLKQEFMKKRKKGKLPKEARQQLLDWWSRHYKWPYPSESQKLALAEATGLDQKQINNWFINQRKRHWKPTEDMQLVVMDAAHHHHLHPHYYIDNELGNPFPMDISSPQLL